MQLELFKGDGVRLGPLLSTDAEAIAEWFSDAAFLRLYSGTVAFPKTVEEITKMLREMRDSKTQFMFALRELEGDRLLGFGGFDEVLWRNGVGWFTIALAPPVWGQGYGTIMTRLLLRFAFDELNLHKVQLTVFDYNERALALYRHQGFQQEGIFREAIYRDGHYYHMILMGLLDREWRASVGR